MAKNLTREQMQFVQSELYNLERSELQRINEACEVKREVYTFGQLIADIKRGKVKLSPTLDASEEAMGYDGLAHVFGHEFQSSRPVYDQPKLKRMTRLHEEKWAAIKRRVILADAPEALKMLEELQPAIKA